MAKFNYLSNNFKSGEFGPKMAARTDVEEYKESAEEILNMFPIKQGGVTKRSGSRAEESLEKYPLGQGNDTVRNIPFIFSKTEAYVVTINTSVTLQEDIDNTTVLTDTNSLSQINEGHYSLPASAYFKIFKRESVPVVNGDLGNPYDDRIASYGEASIISNEIYYYDPYFKSQFNIIGADTSLFQYAQSGDILIITHASGTIPPIVVARNQIENGSDTFTIDWFHRFDLKAFFGIPFTAKYYSAVTRFPFRAPNVKDIAISGTYIETHRSSIENPTTGPDANTTGQLNLYDVYELRSNSPIFTEEKLGTTYLIDILDGVDIKTVDFIIVDVDYDDGGGATSPNYCLAITSRYHSADHSVDIFNDNPENPATTAPSSFIATDNWSEAAWSDEYGFPKSVCFFEQRLMFGGSLRDVDSVWGSRTGNIFVMLSRKFEQDKAGSDVTKLNNFIPSNVPEKDKVLDIYGNVNLETDPIDFKPSSQEINSIQWISSGDALMIGTTGAEYVVSGGQKALSATSVSYRRQTSRGSSPVQPARVDNEIIYIIRDGRGCYNFRFNESNGSYLSNELNLHADHIVDIGEGEEISQFRTLEYCSSRNIVLGVTTDDELIGFTYSPANKVMAWHRFNLGGATKIHSVCSIPSLEGDVDEIWVTLDREGGRRIEVIGNDFMGETFDNPLSPLRFLDGFIEFNNFPSGQQIFNNSGSTDAVVYVDGKFFGPFIQDDGSTGMTINQDANTIIVGVPFEAHVITNDLNAGGEFGTSLGLTQRIDRVSALLFRSYSVLSGHPNDKLDPIKNMKTNGFSTGTYDSNFAKSPSEDGAKVKIQSVGAYPLTVLGIVSRGQTYDR